MTMTSIIDHAFDFYDASSRFFEARGELEIFAIIAAPVLILIAIKFYAYSQS